MTIKHDEFGQHSDNPKELIPALQAQIETHRPHAVKCLEAAYEFILAVQGAEAETMENGEPGVNLIPLVQKLTREKFGVEVSDNEADTAAVVFVRDVVLMSGVSLCVVWQFAHALEHLTWREVH